MKLTKKQKQDIYIHLDRATWLIAGCEGAIDKALEAGDREDMSLEALKKVTTGLYECLSELTTNARNDAKIERNSDKDRLLTHGNDKGID